MPLGNWVAMPTFGSESDDERGGKNGGAVSDVRRQLHRRSEEAEGWGEYASERVEKRGEQRRGTLQRRGGVGLRFGGELAAKFGVLEGIWERARRERQAGTRGYSGLFSLEWKRRPSSFRTHRWNFAL